MQVCTNMQDFKNYLGGVTKYDLFTCFKFNIKLYHMVIAMCMYVCMYTCGKLSHLLFYVHMYILNHHENHMTSSDFDTHRTNGNFISFTNQSYHGFYINL